MSTIGHLDERHRDTAVGEPPRHEPRRGLGTGFLLVRGVAGVIFGVLAIALPGVALQTLVLLFAAYMLVDGVFGLAATVRAARAHERWGWFALEALANLAAAAIALGWPGITVLVFVVMTGAWAIVSGALLLIAAVRATRQHGHWLLALAGVVSLVWGALLLVWPAAGAITLVLWLGAYALVFGILFIVFALQSRRKPSSA